MQSSPQVLQLQVPCVRGGDPLAESYTLFQLIEHHRRHHIVKLKACHRTCLRFGNKSPLGSLPNAVPFFYF